MFFPSRWLCVAAGSFYLTPSEYHHWGEKKIRFIDLSYFERGIKWNQNGELFFFSFVEWNVTGPIRTFFFFWATCGKIAVHLLNATLYADGERKKWGVGRDGREVREAVNWNPRSFLLNASLCCRHCVETFSALLKIVGSATRVQFRIRFHGIFWYFIFCVQHFLLSISSVGTFSIHSWNFNIKKNIQNSFPVENIRQMKFLFVKTNGPDGFGTEKRKIINSCHSFIIYPVWTRKKRKEKIKQ